MSREPYSLEVTGTPRIRVATRSGRVTVHAEPRSDILVVDGETLGVVNPADRGEVSLTSGRSGSAALEVRVPVGSDLRVGTSSGRVELRGRFGAVRITTSSGAIDLDQANAADLRSVSGNILVRICGALCRVQTQTGRAEVRETKLTEVSTVSGRVNVDRAGGDVRVRTATGAVEVGTTGPSNVAVQTLSGAVRVKIPGDVRPTARLSSLSGHHSCACEMGDDCQVAVRTMTGKIEVVPS